MIVKKRICCKIGFLSKTANWEDTDAFTLYVMSAGGANSRVGLAESNGSNSLLARHQEKV